MEIHRMNTGQIEITTGFNYFENHKLTRAVCKLCVQNMPPYINSLIAHSKKREEI
jgi:hypothetical protein